TRHSRGHPQSDDSPGLRRSSLIAWPACALVCWGRLFPLRSPRMPPRPILVPARLRRPPASGWSWVDRRFLREHAAHLSRDAVLLYHPCEHEDFVRLSEPFWQIGKMGEIHKITPMWRARISCVPQLSFI